MTDQQWITPPVWLGAKVDQRLALMDEAIPDRPKDAIIAMFLAEPDPSATKEESDRWDRSCDNCGTYCPEGEAFYTGTLRLNHRNQRVIVTLGVCSACRDLP